MILSYTGSALMFVTFILFDLDTIFNVPAKFVFLLNTHLYEISAIKVYSYNSCNTHS